MKEIKNDEVQSQWQKGFVRKQRHPSTWRTVPSSAQISKIPSSEIQTKLIKGISQKAARLSSRNRAIYQKPRTEENFFKSLKKRKKEMKASTL